MTKTCKQCIQQFEITDNDLAFYKKIPPTFGGKTFEIPPPTMCPDCRKQRRLARRNVGKIYARKSDLSGKQIISCVAPNSKFKVYHLDEWMSDQFDPYEHGRDFDFSRPFFEQLHELSVEVPRPHMNVARNENSEYINNSSDCKNCYLIENATAAEDSLYSLGLFYSKDCVDCYKAFGSENCYECINVEKCYGCFYCTSCVDCIESLLCDNCSGCKNCYGCANLSNKQYWIYNELKSKEEFKKRKSELLNATYTGRQKLIEEAEKYSSIQPKKFAHILSSENARGDYIYHSKNVESGFTVSNCEDVKYATNIDYAKDYFDVDFWGDHGELSYECAEVGTGTHSIIFSRKIHGNSKNVYYSIDCNYGCSNLFGCVGMKYAEYSIFNKKYPPEEYEKLVAKIIKYMHETQEWGEFFHGRFSIFGYNETMALDYLPIPKEEAMRLGYKWQDEKYEIDFRGSFYVPKPIEVYKDDKDERGNLLRSALKCQKSGRSYKITPHELLFYIKNNLPIPTIHWEVRMQDRFKLRNPNTLHHYQCMCGEPGHDHSGQCPVTFETTYSPDRKERVYCESCYQRSVI